MFELFDDFNRAARQRRFEFLKRALDNKTPLNVGVLNASGDKGYVTFSLEPAPMLKASGPPSLEASAAKVAEASRALLLAACTTGGPVDARLASFRDLTRNFVKAVEKAVEKADNPRYIVGAGPSVALTLEAQRREIEDAKRALQAANENIQVLREALKGCNDDSARLLEDVARLQSGNARIGLLGAVLVPIPEETVEHLTSVLAYFAGGGNEARRAKGAYEQLARFYKGAKVQMPAAAKAPWEPGLGDRVRVVRLREYGFRTNGYAVGDEFPVAWCRRVGNEWRVARVDGDGRWLHADEVERAEAPPAAKPPKFVRCLSYRGLYPALVKPGEIYKVTRTSSLEPRLKWVDITLNNGGEGSLYKGEYEALPDVPTKCEPGAVVVYDPTGAGPAESRLVIKDMYEVAEMATPTQVERPLRRNGGGDYTPVAWYLGGDFQKIRAEYAKAFPQARL